MILVAECWLVLVSGFWLLVLVAMVSTQRFDNIQSSVKKYSFARGLQLTINNNQYQTPPCLREENFYLNQCSDLRPY